MWTNSRIQDSRGMNHPYPPQPIASANTPWPTTGGILPDGRQMLAGWRPPTALTNGITSTAPGTSLEQKQESVEASTASSNNDPAHELPNDVKDTDKDCGQTNAGVSERKETGKK